MQRSEQSQRVAARILLVLGVLAIVAGVAMAVYAALVSNRLGGGVGVSAALARIRTIGGAIILVTAASGVTLIWASRGLGVNDRDRLES